MSGPDGLPALFERLRQEVREARVTAIVDEARAWAARQPLPEFRPDAAPPPGYPASWPRAIALADVVRWRDADFVRACYEAILRRAPDPAGFALYLEEVRSGRSRVEIAVGFARSDEGRKAGVAIAGLGAATWSLRLARIPVLGYLLRLAKSILTLPRALREREATEAYLAAQVAIAEARMADVAARAAAEAHRVRLETAFVHERQARSLGGRLARLADQSQAMLDRLPAVEAALEQVRPAGGVELGKTVATLRAEIEGAVAAANDAAHTARQALGVAREASGDRDMREARFAAIDAQLAAARQSAAAIEARAGAGAQQAIARIDAALLQEAARLDREIGHGVAQDAQMKAVREASVAELAQATAALEAKLLELVTRENELLERRLSGRVEAAAAIAQDVDGLRAALATFRKDGAP